MILPEVYEKRIAELERRLAALELKPVDVQIQRDSFTANEGQHCLIEAPPAGLTVTLPHARAQNRNLRITFTLRNSNPVRFVAVDSKVNTRSSGVMSLPGTFDAVSDGLTGWGISVLAGSPSAPSGSLSWSSTLAVGNNSGAHNPNIDAGQFLGFGNTATQPAAGQIRASGVFLSQSTGNTTFNSTGGLVAFGGFLGLVLSSNSLTRLFVDSTGAWNLAGTTPGTAGQYFRSSGAGAPPTWATVAIGELASIASDTFVGNVSGAPAAPSAVNLSSLAGNGLGFSSHALNVNVGVSLVISADNVVRAALTGDVTAAQDSNATTIAAHAVTNGKLAQMANDTFKGNVSGATADPSDVNLSTLAGAGLVFGTHTLDVTAGAGGSIVVSANDVQRAALTGAITAAQDSNTTAFGALAAKSVLANATNTSAVPAALAGSAAFQHLRVNSANTGLEWSVLTTGDFPANSVPLSALPNGGPDVFLGNTSGTGALAITSLSTIASASIPYDSLTHTFRRAAMGGDITAALNGNLTAFRTFAGKSVLVNATNASAVPSDLAATAADQYLRVNAAGTGLEWGTLPAGSTPTWATVLAAGNTSGGTDAVLSAGDALIIGTDNATAGNIRGTGSLSVIMSGGVGVTGSAVALTNSSGTANTTFTSGGLQLARSSAILAAPAVAGGVIWSKFQTNGARLVWTDRDTAGGTNDFFLDATGLAPLTATATVSAATTVLTTTGTHTIRANTLIAGSRYRCTFTIRFVRGSTATALNLGVFFNFGGVAVSMSLPAQTAAGTYNLRAEAEFTVLTLGTSGTAFAQITAYGTANTGAVISNTSDFGTLTINTTAAINCSGAAQMNTAVAGTSITATGGNIERVF